MISTRKKTVDETVYTCDKCGYSTADRRDMEQHLEEEFKHDYPARYHNDYLISLDGKQLFRINSPFIVDGSDNGPGSMPVLHREYDIDMGRCMCEDEITPDMVVGTVKKLAAFLRGMLARIGITKVSIPTGIEVCRAGDSWTDGMPLKVDVWQLAELMKASGTDAGNLTEELTDEERLKCMNLDPHDPTFRSFRELASAFTGSAGQFSDWLDGQSVRPDRLPEGAIIVVRKIIAGTPPCDHDLLYVLSEEEYFRQLVLGAKCRLELARKDIREYRDKLRQ